jgi:hypothetical protein
VAAQHLRAASVRTVAPGTSPTAMHKLRIVTLRRELCVPKHMVWVGGDGGGAAPARGQRAHRRAGYEPYSDAQVANRNVWDFGWEMSSRGRFATPADFLLHDGSPVLTCARTTRTGLRLRVVECSMEAYLINARCVVEVAPAPVLTVAWIPKGRDNTHEFNGKIESRVISNLSFCSHVGVV